jgi:hypothetical protein
MTSLEEAAATLRVVIPGFLALRVIYWRGLWTQRTDLELILWSLVASVPIYAAAQRVRPEDDMGTFALAVMFALAAGWIVAETWRALVRRRPGLREFVVPTAWDAVVGRPGGGWFQVRTTDGAVYHGWAHLVAESGQARDLDVYLREPSYVDGESNLLPLAAAEGILIPRSSIVSVLRFRDDAPPVEPASGVAGATPGLQKRTPVQANGGPDGRS